MNTMRHNANQRTKGPGGLLMGFVLTALVISSTIAKAETLGASQSSPCRSAGSEDLNRWPLRTQDLSGCAEKGPKSAIVVRRHFQESSINLWPYVFQPQRGESLEFLPNEEDNNRPPKYVRSEPDLRMWPLWPQS
jgi:hypothetical protein